MSTAIQPGARPAYRLLSNLFTRPLAAPRHHGLISTRTHKTTARTKRALRIRPSEAFELRNAPKGPLRTTPETASVPDEIVYNPPASQPTVFNTPFAFLPRSDPRRAANLGALFAASPPPRVEDLPQPVDDAAKKPWSAPEARGRHHITPEQVAEMQELRTQDPKKWSANKLAKKFDCSVLFVSKATKVPEWFAKKVADDLERRRARWGPKRTLARLERTERRKMLYDGQL